MPFEQDRYEQSEAKRRRNAKRTELMGSRGKDMQNSRQAKSELKAVVKGYLKGDIASEVNLARGREAIKRVGEYKVAVSKKKRDYIPPSSHKRQK